MKTVGLTGNMGSGKTTVAGLFEEIGIAVFYADSAARSLYMRNDIRQAVERNFGTGLYDSNGQINRQKMAKLIFSDREAYDRISNIIHPEVRKLFLDWLQNQFPPYAIYEAAILIESKAYKKLDYLILVKADEHIRLKRVLSRDNISKEEVMARFSRQMPEDEKSKYADFIIDNNGNKPLKEQIIQIHHSLIK